MSNGPQEHNPNRNRNNNRNRNRNRSGENRSNDNRNNENRNRNQGNNPNKPRGVSQHDSFVNRAPAKKLTFWEKIMKMVGLYKEPAKPTRSDTKPNNRDESKAASPRPPRSENQAPRTNTRDTRSGSGSGEARPPREPREQREPRAPREPRERREPSLADVESTRLYIGNLSYDASESDIEELFKGVGPVRRVEIVYNKHTHKSKGYGFVEMLRIDEAKRAVEVLHDQHFMGRQLIVSGAKAKNAEEGEAAVAVREDKEQAKEQAASEARAEARAATAAAASAAAAVAAAEVAEEAAPAIEEVEVATVTETSEVIEEIHSLEGEAQKETFV